MPEVTENTMMDLSYKEQAERLNNRIRAHKLFANFDVDEWIEEFLARCGRHAIFDLGCGNGNHLGLYLRHVQPIGTVAGLDRDGSLIGEAQARHASATNLDLRVGSMDDSLPFPDDTFDLCFSNFAIYNARDPRWTLTELHRVMAPGAELVLIGSTRNNARELYEYNLRLTGTAIDEITAQRSDRLYQEIAPIVRESFSSVQTELLNSFLTFPDRDEFLRYFTSTLLYEQGAEKMGLSKDQLYAACPSEQDIILSKEMLALIARKP